MKKIIFTVMAMAGILLMAGCPNGSTEEDIKSSEKSITSFKFEANNNAALSEDVTGSINGDAITLTVPYGTDRTALKPAINLSAEATVTPASGTAGNFTSPVSYTVTAEDGTTQVYTVTVNVTSNSAKSITSFNFEANNNDALSEDVPGSINGNTISLTVPYGTNVTALVPTISLSPGATVNPASGTAGNFTNPVSYTVRAQDGSTQNYMITVNVTPANTGKSITSFKFEADNNTALSEDVPGSINGNTISLTVPYGTNVTALKPSISVSPWATVNPASSTAGNFTSPVSYTVTAEDGTHQDYTVTVNIASNSAKSITSFKFEADNNDALSEDVTGSINGNAISLTVPYGTNVTALKPSISVSPEATVNPASGTTGNFTSPVSYTVTAQDGTTWDYTVTVNIAPGYNITVSPNGAEGSESVTTSLGTAGSGTQITLTANNLGAGRKVALSAPGISISPAVITASGGTAAFTMPDAEVTVTATFSNQAGRAVEHTADAISFDMHYVPHGSFEMGYTGVATPVHTVTLTKDFWMGKTEVTQGLWEAVWGGSDPWPGDDSHEPSTSKGKGNNYPAYYVNWYDAAAFCNELTKADNSIDDAQQVYYSDEALTTAYTKADAENEAAVYADWNKKGYRLPTEAEWEYAARYIDGTQWNGGNHVSGDTSAPQNTSTVIGDYAWYKENSGDNGGSSNCKSHEVGQKLSNALGLKDMSGNVREWCYDWKADYGSASQSDPVGPGSGSRRVNRGGSCYNGSIYLKVGRRDYGRPSYRLIALGFRLCRTAD